jgi:Raf kinase inhibitor-like YbhB/YbcL family protein
MKKIIAAFLILALLAIIFVLFNRNTKKDTGIMKFSDLPTPAVTMKISSSAFDNRGSIPPKYTCDGENINPPLSFSEVPQDAKSLALIVDDPDAPVGTFTHWIIWNINPHTLQVPEGQVPQDAQVGVNDFGKNSYGGPCPPSGVHRYQFRLYALDTILQLPANSKRSDLERTMDGHILQELVLTGLYQRI